MLKLPNAESGNAMQYHESAAQVGQLTLQIEHNWLKDGELTP
jgi:hypothetical protein